MRRNISFLIGSGFSIPERLPSVTDLNNRFSKIDESEILIHTDQRAYFLLDPSSDPNRWSRRDERLFLQEFLEFYNKEILPLGENFHYEKFYDFYSGFRYLDEKNSAIEDFCKQFNAKYKKISTYTRDAHNRIADFDRSYSQLIAAKLHNKKYHVDVAQLNYPPYDDFIYFLVKLLEIGEIKLHSLNHDLFLDWLCKSHVDLWQHFTDGFQIEGSPFYGLLEYDFKTGNGDESVHKSYYVKLSHFVNNFAKPLSLFKLHGSIFNTLVYPPFPGGPPIRVKANYAIGDYFKEIKDKESGEFQLKRLFAEVVPDFLSGINSKTRSYSKDNYYTELLSHFKENLEDSDLLIVIGYGFKDPGIDDYVEKYFLSQKKLMIIIDPNIPDSKLLEKYNYFHIQKNIITVTKEDFKNLLERI